MIRNLAAEVVLDTPYAGVLMSEIPLTGEDGASIIANDFQPVLDVGSYFYARKVSLTGGDLFLYADGSGTFTAPVGVYYLTYNVYKNGGSLGQGVATFYIGTTSLPIGIAPTTLFGVPTYTLSSYSQTSYPIGIAATTYIGIPSAYNSGGLQTSTPASIPNTTYFGDPSSTLSGVYWVEVGDNTITWTEI